MSSDQYFDPEGRQRRNDTRDSRQTVCVFSAVWLYVEQFGCILEWIYLAPAVLLMLSKYRVLSQRLLFFSVPAHIRGVCFVCVCPV